ncbi:hypothetical protein Pam3_18 [Pseudanabaena phage Pam3]|uniref:Uncharacterized protein n=1 Tax=Pseudanabaena phage Pam3 TaxID=2936519 RepID=A0ACD6BAN1_9CAUD|nr:Chain h, Pam3 plug gp18 [uncultured cyanophage]7YFZ_i Chain i, Pam3 plug gp18 [uncultured cyanophage]7YFZ_j Chain j, Pam3 plug gp18 [uncultured cyanophage]7YFZ_k Chain k, Pam3 plug gp18 [uncultured cyanophage]7YFZ_l Chain l, Pam3 plug gp18 [uncultured cyanophage]7YFZ_m Chain m, Pam3 plug gp18 [uncultured cyanophage]UQS95089.1 hypothetical protein Pam3_18 [Pseudanabaena phage Pam3]
MIELEVLDESKQKFSVILNDRRVTIELWYNTTNDRWSFSLALDGDNVVTGRRLVTGVDLLAPFGLGIGALFLLSENGEPPTRANLPLGLVKLYHATQEEIDAAISA